MLYSFASIGSVLLGFLFSQQVLMAKSQRYFQEQQSNLAAINGYAEENVLRAQTTGLQWCRKRHAWPQCLNQNSTSMRKSQFISGIMFLWWTSCWQFWYVMAVDGATMHINGSISMGTIVAFLLSMYEFFSTSSPNAQGNYNTPISAVAMGRLEFSRSKIWKMISHKSSTINKCKRDI